MVITEDGDSVLDIMKMLKQEIVLLSIRKLLVLCTKEFQFRSKMIERSQLRSSEEVSLKHYRDQKVISLSKYPIKEMILKAFNNQ